MTTGPIEDCLAGQISPAVALARLLLQGGTPDALVRSVAAHRPDGPPRLDAWAALSALLTRRHQALAGLAAEIAQTGGNHAALVPAADAVTGIAAFFDRAVAFSPEASVALYSLGDPAILADATAEIVDWLEREGLLYPASRVVDFGCGIGRMAAALAPRCGGVTALDVSSGMVAEARRRCAALANVQIALSGAAGLADLPDATFDLVLAVDSFPYVLQAGLAAAQVAAAARILRPGGSLVLLNLSYGRTPADDQADAAAWCRLHGLHLHTAGQRPFPLWDAAAYVLTRLV